MGKRIKNRTRSGKKRKPYRFQSAETRQRCVEAGRRSIMAYRARVGNATHRTHGISEAIKTGKIPSEVEQRVSEFEAQILEELGRKPNAREFALIESSKLALAILIQASNRLSSLKRLGRAKWLLSVCATFMNTLRLNLEVLGGHRTTKKIEAALPRVPDMDERAEAERIVQEFIEGSKRA